MCWWKDVLFSASGAPRPEREEWCGASGQAYQGKDDSNLFLIFILFLFIGLVRFSHFRPRFPTPFLQTRGKKKEKKKKRKKKNYVYTLLVE